MFYLVTTWHVGLSFEVLHLAHVRTGTKGPRHLSRRFRTPTNASRHLSRRFRIPTKGSPHFSGGFRTPTKGSRHFSGGFRPPTKGSRHFFRQIRTPTKGSRHLTSGFRTGTNAPPDSQAERSQSYENFAVCPCAVRIRIKKERRINRRNPIHAVHFQRGFFHYRILKVMNPKFRKPVLNIQGFITIIVSAQTSYLSERRSKSTIKPNGLCLVKLPSTNQKNRLEQMK